MYYLKQVLFVFGLFYLVSLQSQPVNWSPVDSPDPVYNPRGLYYSDNLDVTIYCGLFQEGPGHYYAAVYNGDSWEMILDSMYGEVLCAADFLDGVLIGGVDTSEDDEINTIGFYNGEEWSYPWQFNGSVKSLVWNNDTLFALGNFTEIDGVPIYKIAKLVNGMWEPMLLPNEDDSYNPSYNDIAYYNGFYYVGGNFHPQAGPHDFARINNMQMEQVGEGLFGSWLMIGSLEVFQDELYIGGKIPVSQGNVGNHIVKWNGEVYSSVGEPMTVQQGVFGADGGAGWLSVKDDYLYCMGRFHFIGADSISSVARWDGEEWCGLWGTSFLSNTPTFAGISAAGYFQDQFMIVRFYEYADGTSDVFWLYEGGTEVELCTGPLSVNNLTHPQIAFELYPNPAHNQITIQCDEQIVRVEVMDVSGRAVLALGGLPKNAVLDIGGFPAGIYLVRIETDGGYGVRKLVVKE